MTEAALVILRLMLWVVPGVLALLAVRGFFAGRQRVALGLLIAGVAVALLVKPFPVGLAILVIGGLAGLGGGRSPKYARELEERVREHRKR